MACVVSMSPRASDISEHQDGWNAKVLHKCVILPGDILFVPPFYTSSKGLFYTFFEVFVLGVVAHALARSPASATRAATASQMNMATGAVR